MTPDAIAAICTGMAAIITAIGGIYLAKISKTNANTEQMYQLKLDQANSREVILKADVERIRQERDHERQLVVQLKTDLERLNRVIGVIISDWHDFRHDANNRVFNLVIETKADFSKYRLPEIPDIDDYLKNEIRKEHES